MTKYTVTHLHVRYIILDQMNKSVDVDYERHGSV